MEKYVEIETDKGILRGMLHIPDSSQVKSPGLKYPGVVMYHGFTGCRMEPGFMFVRFSRLLAQNGIASVRFDFLGSGESDGCFTDMTFSNEVAQASLILDYFRSLDMIDKDRIFALGLSMGGAISAYLAGTRVPELCGLVLWAPAGEMRAHIDEREKRFENGDLAGNSMDLGGLQLGQGFIDDLRSMNTMERASEFTGKVLLIHGTGDATVPYEVSNQYKVIYKERVEIHLIDGADHTFQKIEWIDQLFRTSLGFIKKFIG